MTFAHPALLALAALAAGPVLIHLLVARLAPVEPWAAVRFLTPAAPARRRAALRDRLVLLLRTLALLSAAVAAAGPRVGGPTAAPADPPALRVAVLDDTLSTARPRGDGTAFARSQRALAALAEAAGPADRFALVRPARADPTTGPPRALGPLGAAEFLRELAAAEPLATAGDVPAALAAAAELIDARADRFPAARVALGTDRAAADWAGPAVAAGLDRLRGAGRGGVRLDWVGPPGPGPPGRVLTDLRASTGDPDPRLDAVPRAGEPAELVAAVRTFGPRPAMSVAFSLDDRFVGRAALPATAGPGLEPVDAAVRVAVPAFPENPEEPGTVRVEARLEGHPGPPALASRFAAVRVRGPLRVLLAADVPLGGAGPADDPAFYLGAALSADPAFAVSRAAFEALPAANLAAYDAVVCAGAPPPPAAAALRAYLGGGGGAAVALRPGDSAADLAGLFAGVSGGVNAGPAVGTADPTNPAAVGFTFDFAPLPGADPHPLAIPLAGIGGDRGGLVTGYRRLSPAADPPAGAWPVRVAARFAGPDGSGADPAVLTAAGPRGGRFAVLATSADATWGGPWPAAGASFAPLIRGLAAFAAVPDPVAPATTGEALAATVPPGRFAAAATLTRPDGTEALLPVAAGRATFGGTDEPGFYRVRFGAAGAGQTFAVNAPPAEADPRTAALPAAAPPAAGVESPGSPLGPTPLTGWVWAAALGLLLAEPVVSRLVSR